MPSSASPSPLKRDGSLDDNSTATLQIALDIRRRGIRDDKGLFWAEGPRAVLAALRNRWHAKSLIYSRRLSQSSIIRDLVSTQKRAGAAITYVSPEIFRGVSVLNRASGIAAIVRQRWTRLTRLAVQAGENVIVVEQLRSSGNLGTIIRTAEAVGCKAIILIGPNTDPFCPAAVRATMGSLFAIPLVRTSAEKFRAWADDHRILRLGLSPKANSIWAYDKCQIAPRPPVALLIGEERKGLSETMRSLCTASVSLPMTGQADSLNVAVATGVMLYELSRDRQSSPLEPSA